MPPRTPARPAVELQTRVSQPDATMPSATACPYCRGNITFDFSLAGQIVLCPHCNSQLQIPAAASATTPDLQPLACTRPKPTSPIFELVPLTQAPAQGNSPSIIACPYCKGHITFDANLAGQVALCPHCQAEFQMPVLQTDPLKHSATTPEAASPCESDSNPFANLNQPESDSPPAAFNVTPSQAQYLAETRAELQAVLELCIVQSVVDGNAFPSEEQTVQWSRAIASLDLFQLRRIKTDEKAVKRLIRQLLDDPSRVGSSLVRELMRRAAQP
jgi:uncharacterized protein YbaR (Trm112 family)